MTSFLDWLANLNITNVEICLSIRFLVSGGTSTPFRQPLQLRNDPFQTLISQRVQLIHLSLHILLELNHTFKLIMTLLTVSGLKVVDLTKLCRFPGCMVSVFVSSCAVVIGYYSTGGGTMRGSTSCLFLSNIYLILTLSFNICIIRGKTGSGI